MWKVKAKAKVISLIIGALGSVTPKLEKWLQTSGAISEISVQKSILLGTANILHKINPPGLW